MFKYKPKPQKYNKNTDSIQSGLCGDTGAPENRADVRSTGIPGAVPLSTAHIRPRVIYYDGASLLKTTKGRTTVQKGGGKRGKIKGFTRQSRRRLMCTIGAIRKNAQLPDFVTLTYPEVFPTVERAKRDIKVFLQRLERQFPDAGYIWKLEPQKRGAPHYHLLVWGCKEGELFRWVVNNWYEIAGNGDFNHWKFHAGALQGSKACVQKVKSFKGVWSYASKYIGKTFEVAEWGAQWTGRFWGIGKRDNIPFGTLVELSLNARVIVQIMRYQRRFSGIRGKDYNSLTVFCDASQWVARLLYPDKIPEAVKG